MATIFLASWSLAHADAEYGPDMAWPRGSAFADHQNAMATCQKELAENAAECEDQTVATWETSEKPGQWFATAYDDEDNVVGWVVVTTSEIF